MLTLLLASALAAPHGPHDSADTGLFHSSPSCEASYPFALQPLPEDKELYRIYDPTRSWGTTTLIDAIATASAYVAHYNPESDTLFIGDMSRAQGGRLYPHRYHSDGRAADIGLYSKGGKQPEEFFQNLWGNQFDAEHTWIFIEGLLSTGEVKHILIDQTHIWLMKKWLRATERLTEEEIRRVFPAAGTDRMWEMEGIVRHAPRHRNHLHVRMRCEGEPLSAD